MWHNEIKNYSFLELQAYGPISWEKLHDDNGITDPSRGG
jgi:hypothetical protein